MHVGHGDVELAVRRTVDVRVADAVLLGDAVAADATISFLLTIYIGSKETLTYTLAVRSNPALYEYPSNEGGIVVGYGPRTFLEFIDGNMKIGCR